MTVDVVSMLSHGIPLGVSHIYIDCLSIYIRSERDRWPVHTILPAASSAHTLNLDNNNEKKVRGDEADCPADAALHH